MKTLIIVDPQYDFIEGGKLPVQGGRKALDKIVELLESGEIGSVCLTQDWHVSDHESFEHFGGQFPEHCIEHSYGASFYENIMDAVRRNNIYYDVIQKGKYVEEFTAFTGLYKEFSGYAQFRTTEGTFLFSYDEEIIICGLAGDYCVLETLKVIAPNFPKVSVYLDGIASLDGGKKLNEYIKENNIDVYNL